MEIRKTVTIVEDAVRPAGARPPEWRVAAIAVITNPLATGHDENLNELVDEGGDLGRYLADRVLQLANRENIAAVGKAAIVGSDGEPEHAQSILYPRFASAVRDALNLPNVRMIGDKKLAQAGVTIGVTLYPIGGGANQPFGTMEIRVPGSTESDAILVALVAAGTGART